MRTIRTWLTACALALPAPAVAWDYPGHRIVGAVADIVLAKENPDAYQRVRKLIATRDAAGNIVERTLQEVAVFPDCAKNEEAYCRRRPTLEETAYVLRNLMHKSFHFTNSPFQPKHYTAGSVGTSETDVVQMISYAVEQLQGKKPYIYEVDLTDAEAIWLLAHLVGDIHQPLHVGQAYFDTTCERMIDPNASRTIEAVTTLGGNLIKSTGPDKRSLHLYWDSDTVVHAMRNAGVGGNEQAFAEKLAATPPAAWQTSGEPRKWAEEWAAQSMDIASKAYQSKDIKIAHDKAHDRRPHFPSATISCGLTFEMKPDYEDWAAKMAQSQLQKGGFRLAALLAAIFK